ncbi:DUF4043 family protein [Bartonella taylorii]|uniref:phage capsid family protein n=1 Tax=Bartonella taylorii TaxID=33046 RepID=UPI001ABB96E4
MQNANERISRNQNHPLFENALGIYRNVILRESAYVTNGVHLTNNTALANVRRAVLLGSQSVIMAFGKNYSFETVSINSDENPPTMTLETIRGMKRHKHSKLSTS